MVSKMKELIAELNNASFLYYNSGNSPLSDIEFDNKLKELQLLEKQTGIILSNSPTINVGAPVLDSMKKVHNPFAMLTVLDVMRDLKISESAVYKTFNRKDFPAIKVGKKYKVMLLAYLIWKMDRRD